MAGHIRVATGVGGHAVSALGEAAAEAGNPERPASGVELHEAHVQAARVGQPEGTERPFARKLGGE